jgi:hypothetical protein
MKNGIRAIGAAAALGLVLLLPAMSVADETEGDPVAAAAWKRMAELGRQSSDLRVRIVYSLGDLELRDGGGVRQQEAIPIETLVEQARGSTDPVVLSLLVDRCSDDLRKAGRCDPVDPARRWTVADTQNQLAWVALSTVLASSGDVDAARVAFCRAAQASQWHEYYPEVGRLLESVAPKGGDPATRATLLLAVLTRSFLAVPYSHYQTINTRCKEAAASDACGRILETMSRDGQSLMTINLAASLGTARSTLPVANVAILRQRSDAMQWAALSSAGRIEENPTTEAGAVRSASYLEALIATGEVATFRRYLQGERISESEAARNYVATLSADQLARRTYPVVKAATSTN